MKTVYVVDESGKLQGVNVISDDDVVYDNFIQQAPPAHNIEREVPVWRNNKWSLDLTESGIKACFDDLRKKRNELLVKSDWTQVNDAPITEEQREFMRSYRQQLRDLPAIIQDPRNIAWPINPLNTSTI